MRPNNENAKYLMEAGIAYTDAIELQRIERQLHRWHERECGSSDDFCSRSITRGRKVKGVFEYNDDGTPFEEIHYNRGPARAIYIPIRDMENSAKKRLARIMKRYPQLSAYIQTDPRGAALYIIRPGDVLKDEDVRACYNRGICVWSKS